MDYFTNNWNEFMGNPDRTPFDAWSMPNENQEHVKLTPQNVEFALNEIYNGEAAVNNQETPALVFVNGGNGKIYRTSLQGGASRSGNGNGNAAFGNIGDWTVDMNVSQFSGAQAASEFGDYRDNQHPSITFGDGTVWPLYQGNDVQTQFFKGDWTDGNGDPQTTGGMGSLGWGSFTANAYNRATGAGSVAMGFNNIAGENINDGGPFGLSQFASINVGQTVFGKASRALGDVSFAAGFRNTAQGNKSVAVGNFNYATGDSSVAIGKTSYAQGASTIAIGFKAHAAGDGSVALGQENVSWGSTNFTAGFQNISGDVTAARGTGGSAVAMGKYNMATADASMALNRQTTAKNQAATSMGFGTTADNLGMLAIGVNNLAGQGNTEANSYNNVNVNGGPGPGAAVGVAFVIGNGDIDVTTDASGNITSALKGSNSSDAFVVMYDGDATLAGDLTINSDARLKSNIVSLGSTLAKLMQIDGKSYTMKSNDKESKIGLLAQEIEEVFPELVKSGMDKNKTLSVNYQGLIPVLINAIKEQQEELNDIRKSVNEDR
jgi:hypothetical protein